MGSKKSPSGPYADKLWREALRRAVLKRIEKDQCLDLIAEKVVAAAMEGKLEAAREIGDRLDGKPHQSSDTTVRTERYVVHAPPPEKTADEWSGKHGPH